VCRAGAELDGTDRELAEQAGSKIEEFQSDRGQPFVLLRVFLSPNQGSNPGRVTASSPRENGFRDPLGGLILWLDSLPALRGL